MFCFFTSIAVWIHSSIVITFDCGFQEKSTISFVRSIFVRLFDDEVFDWNIKLSWCFRRNEAVSRKIEALSNLFVWIDVLSDEDFFSILRISSKFEINWLNKSRRRFSFSFRYCLFSWNRKSIDSNRFFLFWLFTFLLVNV